MKEHNDWLIIASAANDCVVNILDLASFREAFSTVPGDTNWNPDADFNGDDQVNVIDPGARNRGDVIAL